MTDHEWSEWIEHDGRGCPLPLGTWVEGTDGLGNFAAGRALSRGGKSWDWSNVDEVKLIIRYRYRISKAMRDLKRIAENPAPVNETEEV